MKITKAQLESIYVMVGKAKPAQLSSLSLTEKKAIDFVRGVFDQEAQARTKEEKKKGVFRGPENFQIDDETFHTLEGIKSKLVSQTTKKSLQFQPDDQLKSFAEVKRQDKERSVDEFVYQLLNRCSDIDEELLIQIVNLFEKNLDKPQVEFCTHFEQGVIQLSGNEDYKTQAVEVFREWMEAPIAEVIQKEITRNFSIELRSLVSNEAQKVQPGLIYNIIHDFNQILGNEFNEGSYTVKEYSWALWKFVNHIKEMQEQNQAQFENELKESTSNQGQLSLENETRMQIYPAAKDAAINQSIKHTSVINELMTKLQPEIQNHQDLVPKIMDLFKQSIVKALETDDFEPTVTMTKNVDEECLRLVQLLQAEDEQFLNDEIKSYKEQISELQNQLQQGKDEELHDKQTMAEQQLGVYQNSLKERSEIFNKLIKYYGGYGDY